MGLIPWKRLILGPTLHLQIRNDVLSGRRRRFISPAFADLLDSGSVVPKFTVAHSSRRTARHLIRPFVNLRKRFAKGGQRVAAMLGKGRHIKSYLAQATAAIKAAVTHFKANPARFLKSTGIGAGQPSGTSASSLL